MLKNLLISFCLLIPALVAAQIPKGIPHQSEPVDFSDPVNTLIYIGIPVLMVVLFIMVRRWRRRQK